jgi:hypothetical protein
MIARELPPHRGKDWQHRHAHENVFNVSVPDMANPCDDSHWRGFALLNPLPWT